MERDKTYSNESIVRFSSGFNHSTQGLFGLQMIKSSLFYQISLYIERTLTIYRTDIDPYIERTLTIYRMDIPPI